MSRPVTTEELRRVLEALRVRHCADTEPLRMQDADRALAALPAEQERDDDTLEPLSPKWSDFALAGEQQDSAVPELPPDALLHGFARSVYASTYRELRTAAESLRERLGAALAWQREARKAMGSDAWLPDEMAKMQERIEQAEKNAAAFERVAVAANRGRDDAIARAEQAEAERDEARAQIDQAQRQEPVAWRCRIHGVTVRPPCTDYRPWHAPECLPLYAAPVPAAGVASQIAAAEQRGRAAAFEEVAAECEQRGHNNAKRCDRRTSAAACWDIAEWCRERAEEVRG